MGKGLIITGWNRTLFTEPDDLELFYQIALDEFVRRAKHISLWKKAPGVIPLGLGLKTRMRRPTNGEVVKAEDIQRTYDSFNDRVINGTPVENIQKSAKRYAQPKPEESQWKKFILDPLNSMFKSLSDYNLAIVSSAYDDGIKAVLDKVGFNNKFAYIIGSALEEADGIASGIRLRHYRSKSSAVEGLIGKELGFDNIVLFGDDDRDEQCFEANIDRISRFVVAPSASDAYRDHMRSEYRSKVRTPSADTNDIYNALTKN